MLEDYCNISSAKIKQFQNAGIFNEDDLLRYYPKRYDDFSKISTVNSSNINKKVTLIGTLLNCSVMGPYSNILCCDFKVNEKIIKVLWFNQIYLYNDLFLLRKKQVLICGKLTLSSKYNSYNIVNPDIITDKIQDGLGFYPVYRKIPGMSVEYFKNTLKCVLSKYQPEEYLSTDVLTKFNLVSYKDLFMKIHFPKTIEDINATKRRLIFDDMFYFASKLIKEYTVSPKTEIRIKKDSLMNDIVNKLPYTLTADQIKVIEDIKYQMKSNKRVNALIQGDVGCGKTIVAFLLMILLAENGYQSVFLAPTQVLAQQHYEDFCKITKNIPNFNVELLYSKTKVKDRRNALNSVKSGTCRCLIGTHSVLSEDIEYNNLGLIIVDEEHKFGVIQRDKVLKVSDNGVHNITMSATPIPRSLAMGLYSDSKSIYNINSMPKGRKEIKTFIQANDKANIDFIKSKLKEGRQAYVVCPLVKDSENDKLVDVESVDSIFNTFKETLGDEFKVAKLTGQTPLKEQQEIIKEFKNNNIQILIATTVIEVGVNVPNSSIILIKNAERFGLSQLHQLRGRVGRGDYQSYCILSPCDNCSDNTLTRLEIMCKTSNGFEISEADLKYRGAGDFIGTHQSGDNRYVELMLLFPKFFEKVKKQAQAYINISNKIHQP